MIRSKYLSFLFAALLLATCLAASEAQAGSPMRVTTGFWTLAHFATIVGGERVTVHTITPAGAEPHDFEPSAREIKNIYDSKVFIFQGAGLEPWAERISNDLRRKGVSVLDMASAMKPYLGVPRPMRHALVSPGVKAQKDKSSQGKVDPHFWLDPVHAARMVALIADALVAGDPEGEVFYRENEADYISLIRDLDREYRDTLKPCVLRHIVVTHDAFSYMADRYGFQVHSISGISPQEVPTPARLANLTRLVRQEGVSYIFAEPYTSRRTADTLARETGAGVLVLNPLGALGRQDEASGKTYLSVMRENLDALGKAMRCD